MDNNNQKKTKKQLTIKKAITVSITINNDQKQY